MPVDGRVTTSAGMSATIPVPREFLNETIAHIDDATELHVTLAVFRLASDSGTVPPAVSEDAVLRAIEASCDRLLSFLDGCYGQVVA